MRVYVSVDMEGISGVVHSEELTQGTPGWQAARSWMTSDVLAALDGARAAGMSEAVVVDGHAGMRNLLYEQLPADVIAHRGPAAGRVMCQVEGLDASFDCMLLVGYHSMAGTDGLLSHTWHGGVVGQMRLDGVPVGETMISASIAGHHGVPVVLATGDQHLVAEAARFVPGITTVAVKESTGRQNARCLPLPATTAMIRDAAELAVGQRAGVPPLARAPGPVSIEIDTVHHRHADRIERYVDVERVDVRTVRITADDVPTAFAVAWLAVEVADFEAGAWNQ